MRKALKVTAVAAAFVVVFIALKVIKKARIRRSVRLERAYGTN